MTSLSSSLKVLVSKILYPYELYLREKQSILEAKEEELKHVQVKKENKIDFWLIMMTLTRIHKRI